MAYKFRHSVTGEVIIIESASHQTAVKEAEEMSPFFEYEEN